MQHLIGAVVELQDLALRQVLIVAEEDLLLLHLLLLLLLLLALAHHGARLVDPFFLVGVADPPFLLLKLILELILEILVPGHINNVPLFLQLLLLVPIGVGLLYFLGMAGVPLVFDDLAIGFHLLELPSHC